MAGRCRGGCGALRVSFCRDYDVGFHIRYDDAQHV
jgi:hypothetical protein